MKATPSVVNATAPKQIVPRTGAGKTQRQLLVEPLDLSQEKLKDRADTSTQVMNEILQRDKQSYSFRHWGINE